MTDPTKDRTRNNFRGDETTVTDSTKDPTGNNFHGQVAASQHLIHLVSGPPDGDLDEGEIPRREEPITLNLFEIIILGKENKRGVLERISPTKQPPRMEREKRGRREEYPSFPMQKPSVKAITMPRTGITYLYNISMFVNMNMKGTSLKSGVSPITYLTQTIHTYNRMIDTLM